MVIRLLLGGALLAVTGCGANAPAAREVRLLAPAWAVGDLAAFERRTGCRVELRVYDENEDLEVIADRRDIDVVAAPVPPGGDGDRSEEFVQVTLEGGVEITIPKRLSTAFGGQTRPAGRRSIIWLTRTEGDNDDCGRRWLAYAMSQ